MPTSMTHFYQYLQNLPEYDEALIIFGLHADIRIYMRMYEQREMFTKEQIHSKALQIFEDYIIHDCKWTLQNPRLSAGNASKNSSKDISQCDLNPIPAEILREIRAGYQDRKIRFVLNTGLFSDLYLFTLERLRQYYD